MKNFCSVADFNFLDRVTALNTSLKKYSDDYVLHLLCLDKKIYEKVEEPNIRKYLIDDLVVADKLLANSQNNEPSKEALINTDFSQEKAKKLQFIWSLSAYFSWYCLEHLDIEDILYIDSDIYFFNNWNSIYENIKEHSVGIVEHRCPYNPDNGKFNVGIVYFKNDLEGYKCCTSWKNWLLLNDHQFYKSHGTCGDQKYLELFPQLFSGVVILDEFIGHLAPWNYAHHSYGNNKKILWNNKEQKLLYCHFSNFKPDYEKNTYIPARRHGIISLDNLFLKEIYDEYFECLKGVRK